MAIEEYKKRFREEWISDRELSKEYSKDANQYLLQELATIIDYESKTDGTLHPLDLQGYDRGIKINFKFGIRVRRINKISFADFTVDIKEWNHKITHPHYYYYYAYVQIPIIEHKIFWQTIFDYRKMKKLVDTGKLKYQTQKNKKHSTVSFYGIKLADIQKHNLIIACDGQQDIMTKLGINKENFRIDRF